MQEIHTRERERGTTLIENDKHGPSYVHCNSLEEFQMPHGVNSTTIDVEASTEKDIDVQSGDVKLDDDMKQKIQQYKHYSDQKSPREINESLNLNLGFSSLLNPTNAKVRLVCKILSDFFHFFEDFIFQRWDSIPLRLRQKITMIAWTLYFTLHKYALGRSTGIHKQASLEYHALTTVLYWSRFFPVSIRQMRFSLSQLNVWHGPTVYPPLLPSKTAPPCIENGGSVPLKNGINSLKIQGGIIQTFHRIDGIVANIFEISYDMKFRTELTNHQAKEGEGTIVSGYYLQHCCEPSEKVILWLYGGAFLGGDSKGNMNMAEKMGQMCNYTDIFIPEYRLLPEHTFFDALHDAIQAYEFLVTVRKFHPENITLLGISSGGGLAVRLLQRIAEKNRMIDDATNGADLINSNLRIMPSGAVLVCPFVDFTEPTGSLVEFPAHDLIVNQAVFEVTVPYFDTFQGNQRYTESPVHRSLKSLPPLCVVASEHDICYDQDILLCNRARAAGVDVEIGVWKYMCHVFPLLSAFVPEGRQAVDFICNWIMSNQ